MVSLLPRFLFASIILQVLVQAQYEDGFISIDCGLREGTNYTDEYTGIFYTSDAGYIDTGVNNEIDFSLKSNSYTAQYRNLRSFPEGDRNCYTLRPVVKGKRYLVRAGFVHANYDGTAVPLFDLYLGVNHWKEVAYDAAVTTEIIIIATANYISVCLVKKQGTPFISVLEVRPLALEMYSASNETQALLLYSRRDVGSSGQLRYKDDNYDRIWFPFPSDAYVSLNTTSNVSIDIPMFNPPQKVLSTAVAPANSSADVLYYSWKADTTQEQYHVYRYIAEVEALKPGDVREFNLCVTGHDTCYGPYRPTYLTAETIYTTTPVSGQLKYTCSFVRTAASTLPPIFNAIEIYTLAKLSVVPTNEEDVNSITDVKSGYRLIRNWNGDPCVPQVYTWDGVGCNYSDPTSPRIITLNLSSSGLNGTVLRAIGDLRSLQSLDLSANELTGEIPDFLAGISSLTFLNLSGNNFTGPVPSALLQRSKSGTLQFSVDSSHLSVNNSDACATSSCKKKKKSAAVPIAISLSAVAFVLLVAGFIFWRNFGRRRAGGNVKASNGNSSFNLDNRRFTYAELKSITSDFQTVLGKGGCGTVYYGRISDETQVAVKLLSENSRQGSSEFQIEAQLLTRVYHKNLVQLIGYCAEGDKTALILEYMALGNLSKFLLDKNRAALTWGLRLRIALDVAQGLEYLHTGCKPPIIHRDVKGTNILLNERLEAKIADFGVSKEFSNDDFSHVSTAVKGTLGYLDPEYMVSNNLNEKSDVYSFGIVMLELITGRPAIVHTSNSSERISIADWVNPLVSRGDIRAAIDPMLKGDYDINSAWKSVEIAMACAATKAIQRPTMSFAVSELKECLGVERVTQRNNNLILSSEEMETINSGDSIFCPVAR